MQYRKSHIEHNDEKAQTDVKKIIQVYGYSEFVLILIFVKAREDSSIYDNAQVGGDKFSIV